MNHYTRLGQERLLSKLMDMSNVFCSERKKVETLSDYQLMSLTNKYLTRFDLIPYTEEELEMELN